MNSGIHHLLNPKSIAIIGASKNAKRIGGLLIKYLHKHQYKGNIYPINPKYEDIDGEKCYKYLSDIPHKIDTVLIAVAEKHVLKAILEVAAENVEAAIVFSSGYAETGYEGSKKQKKLKEIADKNNILLCGPNCIGIINFVKKTAMSFSGFLESSKLIPGNIGFVSQSGALGGSILNRAQDRNIGFSYFISTGNEAHLDIVDFIEYLVEDPNTDVIIAYMEGIKDAIKLKRVAKLAGKKGKPIIVLKVGETDTGKKVAASHTGALAGSDKAYDATFRQLGVIRVEDYDDLIDTAMLFSKIRKPVHRRVGVITGTGGGAIILADKLSKYGLNLPFLSENTKKKLSEKIVSFTSVKNPLDLTGQLYNDPNMFKDVINVFIKDKKVDVVVIIVSMAAGERAKQRASYIVEAAKHADKPLLTWWAAGSLSGPGIKLLNKSNIPTFSSPDRCVKALKDIVEYTDYLKKSKDNENKIISDPIIAPANMGNKNKLLIKNNINEHDSKLILASYGIPISREEIASSEKQLISIANNVGYPVALKVGSSQIAHKTEAGGVRLNLKDEYELLRAYEEIKRNCSKSIPNKEKFSVLVQEMINEGIEIIVGVKKDSTFGSMMMFGLGGIYVEIINDISTRILPINRRDAIEMIQETKAYEILKGARGKGKYDITAIVDVLLKISKLGIELQEAYKEIDINPIKVFKDGEGVKVIDALIVRKANS